MDASLDVDDVSYCRDCWQSWTTSLTEIICPHCRAHYRWLPFDVKACVYWDEEHGGLLEIGNYMATITKEEFADDASTPTILKRLWPSIQAALPGKQKAIERSLRYFMRRSREVAAKEGGSCSTS